MIERARLFLGCLFCRETVLRSLKVSAFITPILLVINHPELLHGAGVTWSLLPKAGLTALVPFCVSGYSSAVQRMCALCVDSSSGGDSGCPTVPPN